MLITADRVVTSAGVLSPGWVEISGERIVGVGAGVPRAGAGAAAGIEAGAGAREVRALGDAVLVPGFVDVHVHGGGGGGYTGGDRDSAVRARDAHLTHGTTTTMASLVTASPAALLAQVRVLAALAAEGTIRGIHLEGPWLSPASAGAHDVAQLRAPDAAEIDALLEAAGGSLAMVTLAPELPGALAAIGRLVDAGVVVAIGHTDADYAATRRAIDAGATVATHLCNAMRPLHHREPGPALALLEDPRVAVEVIADGVHLHPAMVAAIEAAAGADRALYVTDAMDAAACSDGDYRLGGLAVTVAKGVARLAGTDTIAGGTANMHALFRARALRGSGADSDLRAPGSGSAALGSARIGDAALVAAVRLTATNPARAMGWREAGDIAPGRVADLVVLDGGLGLREVMRRGEKVHAA